MADDETGDDHRSSGADTRPRASSRRHARSNSSRRSFWRELPVLVVVAVVLALLIRTFLIQTFFIPSGSMENTLIPPDRVLVNKLAYDLHTVHRGDVVVFVSPTSWRSDPSEKDFIKRVIGTPGDEVSCCDAHGRMEVNGKPLREPYVYPGNAPSLITFDVKVPPGRLFVCGDHRDDSADSRRHLDYAGGTGTISENSLVGRAFAVMWPPRHWKLLGDPPTFNGVPPPT